MLFTLTLLVTPANIYMLTHGAALPPTAVEPVPLAGDINTNTNINTNANTNNIDRTVYHPFYCLIHFFLNSWSSCFIFIFRPRITGSAPMSSIGYILWNGHTLYLSFTNPHCLEIRRVWWSWESRLVMSMMIIWAGSLLYTTTQYNDDIVCYDMSYRMSHSVYRAFCVVYCKCRPH